MRKAVFAFLLFLLFLLLPKTALADSNFSTDYNVTYTVSSNANTHVNLNGELKNLTDKYYAASYSVQVGFTDIQNLRTSDSDGSITPKVTKTSDGSTILLTFNRNVVGLNNKIVFNISFDTSEVAENFNNIWDINIPGISKENDFSSFNVTVIYPSFLKKPSFIKPEVINQTASYSANRLFFNKENLGNSGISIAFGDFQVYDFNLKYSLENKNLFPISTEIALPPSTNYQDVSIDSVNPKPVNVKVDKDGNWLAQYIISSSKKINVEVVGKAKVYLRPKTEELDKNLEKEYLSSEKYWDSNSPTIKELAKKLKTPYEIYNYVVKTLNYDFSRVESKSPRLGAVEALNSPNSAVCLEFTDLFIAIARAAGIPAREVDGYAYTNNKNDRPLSFVKDILHAWPEYYDFDKKTWVMIDPTWGNTTGGIDYFNTLDFDHIAFIVKGVNSNYPIPAGGYKLSEDLNTKDVNVEIGDLFKDSPSNLKAEISITNPILAGLPLEGSVRISNEGSMLIDSKQIDVSTNVLTPNSQTVFSSKIPPYGHQIITLSFNRTPILTNKTDTIRISFDNNTTYKDVKILPFFVNRLFILGGLAFVSICIIISLTAYLYRRISLSRQRR